jgi:hypothetical protein
MIVLAVCALCGDEKPYGIRTQLVDWKEPNPEPFSAVPRCDDRTACRARVQERDEPWLVREESVR